MAMIANRNVSVATIRDVLNAAGGSVSNDTTSFFTANAKINKWAKYKPFAYAVNFLDNTTSDAENIRMKAYQGFEKTTCPYFNKMHNAALWVYNNGTSPTPTNGSISEIFKYVLPTGGSSQPFRLADFRGYNTYVSEPIGTCSNSITIASGVGKFTFYENSDSSNLLRLKDLRMNIGGSDVEFKNLYFGVGITNGTDTYYATNNNPILNTGAVLSKSGFPSAPIGSEGEWIAFGFLTYDQNYSWTKVNATTSSDFGTYIPFIWSGTNMYIYTDEMYIETTIESYVNPIQQGSYYVVNYNIAIRNMGTNAIVTDNGKVNIKIQDAYGNSIYASSSVYLESEYLYSGYTYKSGEINVSISGVQLEDLYINVSFDAYSSSDSSKTQSVSVTSKVSTGM